MRRFSVRILSWLCLISALSLLSLAGCSNLFTRSQSPEDEEEDETELKVDKVGDHVTVAGLLSQQIEGIGLVVNLSGTGGDPSPSLYRTRLLDEMKKHGVVSPEKTLADPATALVLVRAVVPPATQVGDRIDLEVIAPESSNATSLAGGLLLPVDLAEQGVAFGQMLKGHVVGKGGGPVMVTVTDDGGAKSGMLRRGKVLGGGVYIGGILKRDRPLELYLRSDYRSVRNAKRMADRIGYRFHAMEKGIKKPLAKATTDQHIELKVHPRYKQNYARYVQVIRQISVSETSLEEHARLERLAKSLMVPHQASASALDLEAIGGDAAIAVLKEGLKSPNEEVRFYSADALAYLGNSDGAAELAKAAEREEAFRVFALASLSILDDGETHAHLKALMDERSTPEAAQEAGDVVQLASASGETGSVVTASAAEVESIKHGAETRYGAFRALKTLDRNEPFIRGEVINQQFVLHVLRTTGEPMVHLSRNKVQEVVLFGSEQELLRPLTLTAGLHIQVNAPAGSDTITVSRFEVGKADQERIVSPRLADVIRAIGDLGGTYPDVAQMLLQARRQSNLEGRLEIDALPQAGRIYYRKQGDTQNPAQKKTQVGQPDRSPNIFPNVGPEDLSALDRLSRNTPAPQPARRPVSEGETADESNDSASSPGTAGSAVDEEEDEDAESEKVKTGIFSGMFKSKKNQSEPKLELK